MADINGIIDVNITRETLSTSSEAFGVGAIIAEFTPGNLNTSMEGDNGRYKTYTSLKLMALDGWEETDLVYLAARTYFEEEGSPSKFFVGLRKAGDDTWTDALNAVLVDNSGGWYGFSCILSTTDYLTFNEIIGEIATWAETQTKLFFFSTAQKAAIDQLVLLSKGTFTSGKMGAIANFQGVKDGQFQVSKDEAAPVVVKDINMSSVATPGEWETGSVAGNLSNFQAVDDGEITVEMDAVTAVDVEDLDFTGVSDFAGVAAVLQAGVRLGAGLASANVTYNTSIKKFIFQSSTTGPTSIMVVSAVSIGTGTDITGESYLNGGVSEPGQSAGGVSDFDDVATAIQAAIIAAGVTGVTVTYDSIGLRMVFTSETDGYDSSVDITEVGDQVGEELLGTSYLNSGVLLFGTEVGPTPGIDDIGTYLKELGVDRTCWTYHEYARDAAHIATADMEWIEFAWMGQIFGNYDPAEANWAYKTFEDNQYITTSEINNDQHTFVIGNNGNTYTTTGKKDVTLFGTVASGEYIDIMRGTDWLIARLVEDTYKPLYENPKVAFTDVGISLEEVQVRAVLDEASTYLINNDSIVLDIPAAADVSTADKAARKLSGITFRATYQGAINKVSIEGFIGL